MSSSDSYGNPRTREAILDATWALLEEAESKITLAQAAARAGVSRQAVYLHFGDRSGLLVALVDHIDVRLGRDDVRSYVHGAPSGVEGLRRWVESMGSYTGKIDRVTQVLESGQYEDEALAAAWRDRMNGRLGHIHRVLKRIVDEGRLREEWSIDAAADLIYGVTLPSPWRELTKQQGWSSQDYADRVWQLFEQGFLTAEPFDRP